MSKDLYVVVGGSWWSNGFLTAVSHSLGCSLSSTTAGLWIAVDRCCWYRLVCIISCSGGWVISDEPCRTRRDVPRRRKKANVRKFVRSWFPEKEVILVSGLLQGEKAGCLSCVSQPWRIGKMDSILFPQPLTGQGAAVPRAVQYREDMKVSTNWVCR